MDDVFDIARAGRYLLADARASRDGLLALQTYNADGVRMYREYLME